MGAFNYFISCFHNNIIDLFGNNLNVKLHADGFKIYTVTHNINKLRFPSHYSGVYQRGGGWEHDLPRISSGGRELRWFWKKWGGVWSFDFFLGYMIGLIYTWKYALIRKLHLIILFIDNGLLVCLFVCLFIHSNIHSDIQRQLLILWIQHE